jgi:hypothetical protein
VFSLVFTLLFLGVKSYLDKRNAARESSVGASATADSSKASADALVAAISTTEQLLSRLETERDSVAAEFVRDQKMDPQTEAEERRVVEQHLEEIFKVVAKSEGKSDVEDFSAQAAMYGFTPAFGFSHRRMADDEEWTYREYTPEEKKRLAMEKAAEERKTEEAEAPRAEVSPIM